jgi:hypothetical protein
MGDPTLRMHTVTPPANLSCVPVKDGADLYWDASPETVVGYHVYRAKHGNGPYVRLTSNPIETCSFKDISAGTGDSYMVRAVKLESSASGTYYNGSQGVFYLPGNAGQLAATGGEKAASSSSDAQIPVTMEKPTALAAPTGR